MERENKESRYKLEDLNETTTRGKVLVFRQLNGMHIFDKQRSVVELLELLEAKNLILTNNLYDLVCETLEHSLKESLEKPRTMLVYADFYVYQMIDTLIEKFNVDYHYSPNKMIKKERPIFIHRPEDLQPYELE